jgi:hypothetical protein
MSQHLRPNENGGIERERGMLKFPVIRLKLRYHLIMTIIQLTKTGDTKVPARQDTRDGFNNVRFSRDGQDHRGSDYIWTLCPYPAHKLDIYAVEASHKSKEWTRQTSDPFRLRGDFHSKCAAAIIMPL